MDSKYYSDNNKLTGKKDSKASPSKLITLSCIILSILLPYGIITVFSRQSPRTNEHLTVDPIVLPPKSSEPVLKLPTTEKLVTTPTRYPKLTVKHITTKSGDNLASLFKQLGLSTKTLHNIINDNPHRQKLKSIKPKQKLEFQLNTNAELVKLIIPVTSSQKLIIEKKNGQYISQLKTLKLQSHLHYTTATIKGSLYQTSKQLQIPYKLLHQMANIFKWQIDFSRDIREGDQFTLIYKTYYNDDKVIGVGDITAAKLTNRGKEYQAIGYLHNNRYAYYTPNGKNLTKAFDRYPIRYTHISSPYTIARNHPVLGFVRPHRGIDLAARMGTPIKATSNGKIIKIGRHGGYGNMIEVKHLNGYSTRYAHMVRFQNGLHHGSHVKRGQVIGFVGQTGLADGPHCHYEFLYHDKQKNPATITLPHAPAIPHKYLADFKARASTMIAQLKLYEEAQLASDSSRPTSALG